MNRPHLSLTTKTAEPLQVGNESVSLQSKVLEFHFPWGGFVWNQPAAVQVTRNGQVQEAAIPDPTLKLMLGLAVINALVLLVAVAARLRR
jgi:hypothetical protein